METPNPDQNDVIKRYESPRKDRWNTVTDKHYKINSLLKFQLEIFCNAVKYDFDCVGLVDGAIEGSGKSVLAQQVAYYFAWRMGKKFTIDNIVFTPEQFQEAIKNAEKFSCIVWDEAYAGTSKYRQMSGINQTISTMLMQIRQKNLFIIIVLPYFFDLNSYIAVPRSWYLLHVDLSTQLDTEPTEDGEPPTELDFDKPVFVRGTFQFYSRKRKKALFFENRRTYEYSIRGNFIGNFPLFYTVDEVEYRAKKLKYGSGSDEKKTSTMDEYTFIQSCLERGMTVSQIKPFTTMSQSLIYKLRNKLNETSDTLQSRDDDE